MNGESQESSAFLSLFKVPLNVWCNLIVMVQGRTVSSLLLTQHTVYHAHHHHNEKNMLIVIASQVAVNMVCLDKDQRTVKTSEYM